MRRWYYRKVLLMLCVFAPVQVALAAADTLHVYYFEYPPYYYHLPSGQPTGLIVELSQRIFARAGIDARLEFIPAKRILHEIQSGRPVASLGWFKTPERETFARFSQPVYINKPVELLFLREHAARFQSYDTLEALMDSRQFVAGRVGGFSDGPYIDALMARFPDRVVEVPGDSVRLIAMLQADRFDFVLAPPEEVGPLFDAAGVSSSAFMLQPMSDIPAGNIRHIMYSLTVDQDLIRRIDDAIVAEIGNPPPTGNIHE